MNTCCFERQWRSVSQPRVAPHGATLGGRPGGFEPQRGSGLRCDLRWRGQGLNPFRVRGFGRTVSQGGSFHTTLGWRPESRWDSPWAEFWKLEKQTEKMLEGLAGA